MPAAFSLALAAVAAAAAAADPFPADLPLRVTSVIPATSSVGGDAAAPVLLSGATPLTVTFSRAVIPLGVDADDYDAPFTISAPVPGRLRWPTTFQARFDPDVDWPSDLDFELVVNPALESFDGALIQDPPTQAYKTPSQSMSIANAHSDFLHNATDGLYDARISQAGYGAPEMVFDTWVSLTFGYPIDADMVAAALVLAPVDRSGDTLAIAASRPCARTFYQHCLEIQAPALDTDTEYTLTLPVGAEYHPDAGVLPEARVVTVRGPVSFSFPFVQVEIPTEENHYEFKPQYRRLDLWVRHGLAPSVTPADLAAAFSVPPLAAFEVSIPQAATVRISGDFQPETVYDIVVAASSAVVDSLGFSLEDSVSEFAMAPLPTYAVQASGMVDFGASAPAAWRVLALGETASPERRIQAAPVTWDGLLPALAAIEDRYSSPLEPTQVVPLPDLDEPSTLELDLAALLAETGLALREQYDRVLYDGRLYKSEAAFVGEPRFGAAVLSAPGALHIVVSSLAANEPLANARVFVVEHLGYSSGHQVLTEVVTDAMGIATVETSTSGQSLSVFVEDSDGHISYLHRLYAPSAPQVRAQVALTTDLGVYKPGDTVSIKGYVRGDLEPDTTLRLQWSFLDADLYSEIDVTPDSFSAFDAQVVVPVGATYGPIQFGLNAATFAPGSQRSIVVADPRPPTVTMDVSSATRVYFPGTPAAVTVALGTFTGTAVADDVTVTWTLVPGDDDGSGSVTGSFSETIFSVGTIEVDIEALAGQPTQEGDSVVITVEWFTGGELLSETVYLPVRVSEVTLAVSVTPAPNMLAPGAAFVVQVRAFDVGGDSVSIDGAQIALDGAVVVADAAACPCVLTMPDGDEPEVVALTVAAAALELETSVELGRSLADWMAKPASQAHALQMTLDAASYERGETAVVEFFNPYAGARAWALVDGDVVDAGFVADAGMAAVEIDTAFCATRCAVAVVVMVPRQAASALQGVPTSLVFDPLQALAFGTSLQIEIREDSAEQPVVSVTMPATVEPGDEVEIELEAVAIPDGTRTQICVMVVDEAMLTVREHPVRDFGGAFSSPVSWVTQALSQLRLISKAGYDAIAAAYAERLPLDPWIVPSWSTTAPWNGALPIELPLDDFLARYVSRITLFPYIYRYDGPEGYYETDGDADDGAGGGGGGGGAGDDDDSAPAPPAGDSSDSGVEVRSDVVRSPLFEPALVLSAPGEKATVSFTAPDNLGTFSVRVFAVTEGSQRFSASEAFVVSALPVSLNAVAPRIARVGDRFRAGVSLAVADDSAGTSLLVSGRIADGAEAFVAADGALEATVALDGVSGRYEATFWFDALDIGEAVLVFEAGGDALEVTIPIEGPQDAIFVATSMAITASPEGAVWPEGIALPEAVGDAGTVEVTAGVGRLASVQVLTDNVFAARTIRSAQSLVASLLPHAYLGSVYGGAAPELAETAASVYVQTIEDLDASCTHPTLGLVWNCRASAVDGNGRPDVHLNAYGVFVSNQVASHNTIVPAAMGAIWWSAMVAGAIDTAEHALMYDSRVACDTLAALRLAIGPEITLGSGSVEAMLGMAELEARIDECSVMGKASAALAHELRGDTSNSFVQDVAQFLQSNLRLQGRTAYVTAWPGSSAPADPAAQSAALLALALAEGGVVDEALVEKLANYVANPAGMLSSKEAAWGLSSLAEHDVLVGNTEPALTLEVAMGELSLLEAEFDAVEDPLAGNTVGWDALPDDGDDEIVFVATGSGQVSVAVGLAYVPAATEPRYAGILVEKTVQLADGAAVGMVAAGTRVIVSIQITTPDHLNAVVVSDLLPGGLEAVDPALESNGPAYFTGPFSARETQTMPDRVEFFARSLYAGTHALQYEAVAATEGTFVLPPAHAFVMEQPELMGLSPGGLAFVVAAADAEIDANDAAAIAESYRVRAVACENDCSGAGSCNINDGTCACRAGFIGTGCQYLVGVAPGAVENLAIDGRTVSWTGGAGGGAPAGFKVAFRAAEINDGAWTRPRMVRDEAVVLPMSVPVGTEFRVAVRAVGQDGEEGTWTMAEFVVGA